MRLRRITIEGFRSFKQKQTVEMPEGNGLFLVRGENLVDDGLTSNDVGKSTFLDAIYWGLYGETTRGLRASNVLSWGGETAIVEQVWEINGKERVFCRQQKPNNVWLDGKHLGYNNDEKKILEAIGLNSSEFLHSVMAGQFSTYFLDLSPTEKLGMFSDILGLNYWEDMADCAKKQAAESDAKIARLDIQIQRIKGKVSSLKEQLEHEEQQYDLWEQEAREKRGQIVEELSGFRKQKKSLQKKIEEATASLKELPDKFALMKRESKLSAEQKTLKESVATRKKDLVLSRCPFCNGALSTKWKSKLQAELVDAEKKLISLMKELACLETEQKDVKEEEDKFGDLIANLELKVDY